MPASTNSLKRTLRPFEVLLITLSNITPAVSVFAIAPGIIQQSGTGAWLSFLAAGAISLLMAFVYAELGSAYPISGGEYAIVGRVLGPLAGFVTLIVCMTGFIFSTAFLSMGISEYLQPVFPNVSPRALGMCTVVMATLLALLNIRVNSVLTGTFLGLELLILGIVAVLGFAHLGHSFQELIFRPVRLNASGVLEPVSPALIALATAGAMYAYNGYGGAVYLGEETNDAAKRIAQVILAALVIGVLAELGPITAVLLGTADLRGLLHSKTMFADFTMERGGQILSLIVSVGIALAVLNAIIAVVLMGARMFFSTGRDQVWPRACNNAITRIHRNFHSPWVATLTFGMAATGACLIDSRSLLIITGSCLVAMLIGLCIAAIVHRRNLTKQGEYRMPFYPWPPVLGLLALSLVVYANFADEDVGRPSLWALFMIVGISIGYYCFILRRRGEWILMGPEE